MNPFFIIIVFFSFLFARSVFAESQINRILENLITTTRLFLIFGATVALAIFVWGVIKFILAAQDTEKLKEARGTMLWGIIGLAVIASLTGIIIALQTYFGVEGGGTIPVPDLPQV